MSNFITFLFALTAVDLTQGLVCWNCNNAYSDKQCREKGFMQKCASSQNSCETEIRNGDHWTMISKQCKQAHACITNYDQNPKAAWSPTQCNVEWTPSVCRCCCTTDLCNDDSKNCLQDNRGSSANTECPRIGVPRFGSRDCEPFLDIRQRTAPNGTRCTFSCSSGYRLIGQRVSVCGRNVILQRYEFNYKMPNCITEQCLPASRSPANGNVECTNRNNIDSECIFSCQEGYKLNGNSKRTCQPNLEWDEAAPRCLPVQCSPVFGNPSNGRVVCSKRNIIGSRCSFSCNFGYSLSGDEVLNCQEDGNTNDLIGAWSNRPPTCTRITCQPELSPPANARVFCSDGNNLGSRCSFRCDTGYTRIGPGVSICRDDGNGDAAGEWSAQAPTCQKVNCEPPRSSPENGQVSCTDTNTFGSSCSFTCDLGYGLVGSSLSVCQSDGSWSAPIPVCRRITCQPPHASPSNGEVSCSSANNLGSDCRFSCNLGYQLNGQIVSSCQENRNENDLLGSWSSPAPTCTKIAILCNPAHSPPDNGRVTCSDRNNEGSSCSFACNSGYGLVGSDTSTCQDDGNGDADGVWSAQAPTCQRITCSPVLTSPANGNVDCSNANNFGSNCRYSCDIGYSLNGPTVSRCQEDGNVNDLIGSWSNPAPTCSRIPVSCKPRNVVPQNGRATCSNDNNEGSRCNFTCNPGFGLIGSKTTICQDDGNGDADGVWSKQAPSCQEITCSPAYVDIENGNVDCSDENNFESSCSFSCNTGYGLIGSDTSVCQDDGNGDVDGEWSSQAPTCGVITCTPTQVDPENGNVDCSDANNFRSSCSFSCNSGFGLVGSDTSVCEDDGSGDVVGVWSAPAPTCPRICIPPHVNPTNGEVICSNGNYQRSTCRFNCNAGYIRIGSAESTCQQDISGNVDWSEPAPTCRRRCELAQSAPSNGIVSCSDSNFEGSTCSFSCNGGYYLDGTPDVTCQAVNGNVEWNEQTPSCERITCTPPHNPPRNGNMNCDDSNYVGSTCRFNCIVPYTLNGANSSVCRDDGDGDSIGVWSHPTPTCALEICLPAFTNLDNGVITCSEANNEGSTCSFLCNDGYYLDGVSSSSCEIGSDGNAAWSNPTAPTCGRITCLPQLNNPANGAVNCIDENYVRSSCRFTCVTGYGIVGSEVLICRDDGNGDANGVWSDSAPTCQRITCSPEQTDPANGVVDCSEENNFGSSCSFTCNIGFGLVGSNTSFCQDDGNGDAIGVWSAPAPTCPRVCIPSHVNPTNGEVICSNSNFQRSTCRFNCNAGYIRIGSSESTCQQDISGNVDWSEPAPTCNISCNPVQRDPTNGNVSCSNTNIEGSICSFNCNLGYALIGPDTTVCQDDGNGDAEGAWSATTPVCQRITCSPAHADPANGQVTCSDVDNYGSSCSFTCNNGYALVGSDTSICRDDGNGDAIGIWSSPAPACQRIACTPAFVDLTNGDVNCSDDNNFGSSCSFSCDFGYGIVGSNTSLCQDDGNGDAIGVWSAPAPTCPRVCIPPHANPTNGEVDCSNGNYQRSTCRFNCNAGYIRIGSAESTCQQDISGNVDWSEPAPTCRRRCEPVQSAPSNGNVSCSDSNFEGSTCSFSCNGGYYVDGTTDVTCQAVENIVEWNEQTPSCERITCTPPHLPPRNGNMDCDDSNYVGSTCRFDCVGPYTLNGANSSVCRDDGDGDSLGVWSQPTPTCALEICLPAFTNLDNGVITCSEANNDGSTCSFSCNDGYYLDGVTSSTCESGSDGNAAWSNPTAPTCGRITCLPQHNNPANGAVNCSDENYVGSSCRFSCATGYGIVGSDVSICRDDGNGDANGVWSELAPSCQKITCNPVQANPQNGNVDCSDRNNFGSSCIFSCNNGYGIVGSNTSVCQDDGNRDAIGVWSAPAPTCPRVCIPPHVNPTNGEVDCSNRNYQRSTCRFNCNTGYIRIGSAESTCQQDISGNVDWSELAPTCNISCNPVQRDPTNGNVSCSNTNIEGSTCSFTCNTGYALIGSDTSVCRDDGNGDAVGAWSESSPTCQIITCSPDHADPANGNVDCSDANNFGSSCSFTCNTGYALIGSDTSVCRDDGNGDAEGIWSSTAPACQRITCTPALVDLTNGDVNCSDENNFGSSCRFSCNFGYGLVGSNTSVCQDDGNGDAAGVWSAPAPTCPRVCIPPHVNPTNGEVDCSNGNYQRSTCRFNCNAGYIRIGSAESTCQQDISGNVDWSEPAPTCRRRCEPIQSAPSNGNVSCSDSNFEGSICRFSCIGGYYVDGTPDVTCQAVENIVEWNEQTPSCERITCKPPHLPPRNGNMDCDDSNYVGSTCRFNCIDPYTLNGANSSVCRDDGDGDSIGVWSHTAPTCALEICLPAFTNLDNGVITCLEANNEGSTCSFSCNNGYYLDGVTSSTCEVGSDGNAAWSNPTAPTCGRITCLPQLNNPANGAVNCSDGNYVGSSCRFSCISGYGVVGSDTSICQDDGNGDPIGVWSETAPTCQRITCTPPHEDPVNGDVGCSDENYFASSCRFTCVTGFGIVGSDTSVCRDDGNGDAKGVWNEPAPICQRITCSPAHVDPVNGNVNCSDSNNFASSCRFTCVTGFGIVGSDTSVCQDDGNGDADGEWSSQAPTCQAITCSPAHVNPENGNVDCSDASNFGSSCSFNCNTGYGIVGSDVSVCRDDGNGDADGIWSEPAPSCDRITCTPAQVDPTNGVVNCSDQANFGSICRFSCNTGFGVVGFDKSICRDDGDGDANGIWSEPTPTCQRITCSPALVVPANGNVACSDGNTFASSCSFTCQPDYALIGSNTSICLDDGNGDAAGVWSEPSPNCQRIVCVPGHVNPSNGQVSCSDSNFLRSSCSFTCQPDYALIGSNTSICRDDGNGDAAGVWNEPSPNCQRIVCVPDHVNPPNGQVSCSDSNFLRSSCRFNCSLGYEIDGTSISECRDDGDGDAEGSWSAQAPTCKLQFCSPAYATLGNGTVSCSNSNWARSVCRFSCNESHYLNGDASSTCQVDESSNQVSWNNPLPSCPLITCKPPFANPTNGTVNCDDVNNIGSQCRFTCDIGYALIGSDTSVCQDDGNGDADGVWSAQAPTCQRITCRPAHVNPASGLVSCSDDNNFGSSCRFSCVTGFGIVGSDTSVCQDDGNGDADGVWSSQAPTCQVITCSPAHVNPENGNVDCSDASNFGSSCSFNCNTGYGIVGSDVSVCRDDGNGDADGIWSEPAPSCDRITCTPAQVDPTNGVVNCSDQANFGSICRFSCNTGFGVVGFDESVCRDDGDGDANGIWSEPTPTCQRITCSPALVIPANGNVACSDGNTFASSCSFTCQPDYALIGSNTSICLDDGNGDAAGVWSEPSPNCQRIVCVPGHVNPSNGQVSCSDSNFLRSSCSFTCQPDYALIGSNTSICRDDGNGDAAGVWNEPSPNCQRIACVPGHVNPSNGQVSCSDSNFLRSNCRFNCSLGYEIDGTSISECRDDGDGDAEGSWSAQAPTCKLQFCSPAYTNLGNGTVSCSNSNWARSVCRFSCNESHYLNGDASSTCQVDESSNQVSWSNPLPSCPLITCKPPFANPTNGTVNCDDVNNIGSQCRFTCDTGYALIGSDTSVCQDDGNGDADGVWSAQAPTCQRITCSPAHVNPASGLVSCSDDNNFGSSCRFSCVTGFGIVGSDTSVCQDDGNGDADGVWSSQAPTCQVITCSPAHVNPENGNVDCSDASNFGSSCSFNCNTGYGIVGSDVSVCRDDGNGDADGIWSEPAPSCDRITCTPAQVDPTNGVVNCSDQANFGSICRFSCNTGFGVVGFDESICRDDGDGDANGIWSEPTPFCQRITCSPALVIPSNGNVVCSDGNTFASSCRFTCQPDYALIGSNTSICRDDGNGDTAGVWSEPSPNCQRIVCVPSHVNPSNGQVSCSDSNFLRSSCRFTCNTGYAVIGADTSVCRDDGDGDADGAWSATAPVCQRITCSPAHADPTNGQVSCSDRNNFGSDCSFTCNTGYALIGSATSICRDDGNGDADGAWSSQAPTCQIITCNPPFENVEDGNVTCSNGNNFDSRCRFICNFGFELNGVSPAICRDDGNGDVEGTWSSRPPVCDRMFCSPAFESLTNGRVTCSNTDNLASTCRFSCNDAYYLDGASTTTCEADSDDNTAWSNPSAPVCRRIACSPQHSNPTNGEVSCSDENYVGSSCSFTCNTGYGLVGSDTSVCQDDENGDALGEWSAPAPTCQTITCSPAHGDPVNGNVVCSDENNFGSICNFTCNFGYGIVGSDTSVCQDDGNGDTIGVWSAPAPTCPRVCIPPHVNPTNGEVICSNSNYQRSTCRFNCNAGYIQIGSSESTCQQDISGNVDWSEPAPTCNISCNPTQRDPTNGNFSCSNTNIEGSTCTFSCNTGYALVGSDTTVCRDDGNGDAEGEWSTQAPTCQRIVCNPAYANIEDGNITCSDTNYFGSSCRFICNFGFKLNGISPTICRDDGNGDVEGTWSSRPPVCDRMFCSPAFESLSNGRVTCSNTDNLASTCRFSCNDAYYLDGASTTTCEADSDDNTAWSNQSAPVCRRIVCSPQHSNPTNGEVSCSDENYVGSSCRFSCTSGFARIGSSTSVCQDDGNGDAEGVWSAQAPTCQRITCTPHEGFDNGEITCSDNSNEGSNCIFQCIFGYYLNGSSSSLCRGQSDDDVNGVWSSPTPTCIEITCLPEFTSLINGNVVCSSKNRLESTCNFECNFGYYLNGSSSSSCDHESGPIGNWTSLAPTCTRITCSPELTNTADGSINCSDQNYLESICRFSCNSGYFVNGSSSLTCNEDNDDDADGVWSNPVPGCDLITCPLLEEFANGEYSCSGNIVSSRCNASCIYGYALTGPGTLFCRDDNDGDAVGVWIPQGIRPECRRITCSSEEFTSLTFGRIDCTDDNNLDSVCRFTCDENYYLDGSDLAACVLVSEGALSGRWNGSEPTCRPIVCSPALDTLTNGNSTCTNENNVGSVCRFVCDVGYYLDGTPNATCEKDSTNLDASQGVWNNRDHTCRISTCSPFYDSSFLDGKGEVSCTNRNNVGSVCTFSCFSGYALDGNSTLVCQANINRPGSWSGQQPTCEASCGPPPRSPDNGFVRCSGSQKDARCEFGCDQYYTRNGPLYTYCIQTDSPVLEWGTFRPTTCQAIVCPSQSLPQGQISCDTENNIASTNCTFRCTDPDYSLFPEGVTENTCQIDSTWNVSKPCCRLVCPPNALIDLSFVLDSSSSAGQNNWEIMIGFVENITRQLQLGDDSTRVSAFGYNRRVDTRSQIYLNRFTNINLFIDALKQIPYGGTGTRTGTALSSARTRIFRQSNGDRSNAQNMLVLMTDGRSQDSVVRASSLLRGNNVIIYVFGIGENVNRAELDSIVGPGNEENLVLVQNFEQLKSFEGSFIDKICESAPCPSE